MEEILYGEIQEGIFKERIRAFLRPFPRGNADQLTGTFVGLEKLLKELPAYKEQFSERAYLEAYNALLLQKSKVEQALRAAEADIDERVRRRIKTGEIEAKPWL